MVPAALMAWTQIIFFLRAAEVSLAQDVVGKLVGMIQYAYLPFLLGRTFWLKVGWAQTADHAIFAALAVANIFNTLDYARILRRLLVGGTTPARR